MGNRTAQGKMGVFYLGDRYYWLSSGVIALSVPHLQALEDALARRGWRKVAIHPGDDYRISGTWEMHRSGSDEPILIDFAGMARDGMSCLPLQESFACEVRGRTSVSLYFRRVNRSRELWQRELAKFVQKLETKGRLRDRKRDDRKRDTTENGTGPIVSRAESGTGPIVS